MTTPAHRAAQSAPIQISLPPRLGGERMSAGRVALVTGGTTGIGAAIAKALREDATLGPVDILVNNAGITRDAMLPPRPPM